MKKKASALLLCCILPGSVCSLAEPAVTEAAFDGFSITREKVQRTADSLDIRFWADSDTMQEAASYHFSLKNANMAEAEAH